jgi:cobalt-zinc-cadmium efflux system protein
MRDLAAGWRPAAGAPSLPGIMTQHSHSGAPAHDHDHHGHDHGDHDHASHAGHDHAAHAGHGHHHHAPKDFGRAFAIGTALNTAFVVVEIGYGLASNSLALVADGLHNLADVGGLVIAWAGIALAKRRPTPTRTYGYRRASILCALVNAAFLLLAVGAIAYEALMRVWHPQPLATTTVMVVSSIGILVNGATALLFMGGSHDINIRGAFLHMAGDAGVSLGVVLSAFLIGLTGWLWIDPAASLAIAAIILFSSWDVARQAVNLAMDAVPENVDRRAVEAFLAALPGVEEVHDVHIWAMSTTETALTAHLVRPGAGLDDALLTQATTTLRERYKIGHVTLQIEAGDPAHPCRFAPDEVV